MRRLKSKIRSGTIEETTPLKLKLFREMKQTCYEGRSESNDTNKDDADIQDEILTPMKNCKANDGRGLDMESIKEYLNVILSNLPTMEEVKKFIMSLDSIHIIMGCLMLIIIYLWSTTQKNNLERDGITLRKSDMINIENKMDEFIIEMRETRKALQDIVQLMKEKESHH